MLHLEVFWKFVCRDRHDDIYSISAPESRQASIDDDNLPEEREEDLNENLQRLLKETIDFVLPANEVSKMGMEGRSSKCGPVLGVNLWLAPRESCNIRGSSGYSTASHEVCQHRLGNIGNYIGNTYR